MSLEANINPELKKLMNPYFGPEEVDPSAYVIADLGITSSDYLDLVNDIEKIFSVDLTSFLIGPNPKYMSMGLIGRLVGERNKVTYRDFTIEELNLFLIED